MDEWEEGEEQKGHMELGHEPVRPFRKVFYITLALGVIYLLLILYKSL
jgi:hypothetical protein